MTNLLFNAIILMSVTNIEIHKITNSMLRVIETTIVAPMYVLAPNDLWSLFFGTVFRLKAYKGAVAVPFNLDR